jgi:hypothetical protein
LLYCPRNHDPLNEIECCSTYFDKAEEAASFQQSYLAWAQAERSEWRLTAPEVGHTGVREVTPLVRLPRILSSRCQSRPKIYLSAHTRSVRAQPDSRHELSDIPSAFAKLGALQQSRGLDLPAQFVGSFINIGCDLVDKLPPETLSETELALFFDGVERQPGRAAKPARRAAYIDIRFLPPLIVGERRIFNLGTLSKVAIALAEEVIGTHYREHVGADPQVQDGNNLLLRVVGSVLGRAYAEGLRIVLSRYAISLFDSKRDRPHLTEPWALIRTNNGVPVEARLIWAKRPDLPD